MMKRIGIILLAVILVVSVLSACSRNKPQPSESSSSAASSQADVKATEKEATKAATEKATDAPAEQIGTIDDYVETAKEKTVDFGDGNTNTLRIPAILLGGSDAVNANAEIMEQYGSVFDEGKGQSGIYSLDYEASLNDKVLSVVVNAKIDGGNTSGLCYCFDVLTKDLLDSKAVCDYAGYNYENEAETLKANLVTYYEQKFSSLPQNDEMKEKTFSDSNLQSAVMYLDGSGKLMALTDIYAAVGGGHWVESIEA